MPLSVRRVAWYPVAAIVALWCGALAGRAQDPGMRPPAATPSAPVAELSVYAAASLRDALQEIAPRCEGPAGVRLVFNFGGSNDLARQILAANKADIFFSADEAWMDRVAR